DPPNKPAYQRLAQADLPRCQRYVCSQPWAKPWTGRRQRNDATAKCRTKQTKSTQVWRTHAPPPPNKKHEHAFARGRPARQWGPVRMSHPARVRRDRLNSVPHVIAYRHFRIGGARSGWWSSLPDRVTRRPSPPFGRHLSGTL